MSSISLNNIDFDIEGPIADSGWVSAGYSHIPNVAIPATSGVIVDLASVGYIPNDGYDYELMMSCWVWTGAISGNSANIWIFNGASTSGRPKIALAMSNTRVASTQTVGKNCIFPLINGNRKLFIYNSASVATGSSWGIQLTGYRRLGTNT